MSTKISGLPAAGGANITDASLVPLVDLTATTVKATVAQVRTALFLTVTGTASVPTATPTATITLPAVGLGIWIVSANLSGAVSTNAAVTFVSSGAGAGTFTAFGSATGGGSLTTMAVSNAGVVSVTQTTGSTQTVTVSALRLQTS